jgi:hypothetical protein
VGGCAAGRYDVLSVMGCEERMGWKGSLFGEAVNWKVVDHPDVKYSHDFCEHV